VIVLSAQVHLSICMFTQLRHEEDLLVVKKCKIAFFISCQVIF